MAARFKGIATPTDSQCYYCRHPEITSEQISVHESHRLFLRCRINLYAPLVTWNCPSFEREPGADDGRIFFNRHLYPEWLTLRRLQGLGNVEKTWLPEPPAGSREPIRWFTPTGPVQYLH